MNLPVPGLLILTYAAFIALGLPDSALGISWPWMHQEWRVGISLVGSVVTLTTLFSAVGGFFSHRITSRWGTGPVVMVSTSLTALGLLIYGLSGNILWLFVGALPLGFGAGCVDGALNHYASQNFSSKHMNWLHGFWGVGAWLGPGVFALSLGVAGTWRWGYGALALVQGLLAGIFFYQRHFWREEKVSTPDGTPNPLKTLPGPFPRWVLSLGPLQFYSYAGLEVGTALWTPTILTSLGFPGPLAAVMTGLFYGSLTLGRFLTGFLSHRWSNRFLVFAGLITALGGLVINGIGLLSIKELFFPGLLLLGLGCAPVYPGLMHETAQRYPEDLARIQIGRQVAFSALGAGTLPFLMGVLAEAWGLGILIPLGILWAVLQLILGRLHDQKT